MATQTRSDCYDRGQELAEAGKYREGLDCICEHLRTSPQDVQALNDAGVILHCLGRSEDAVAYLTKAWVLSGDNGQVAWNLAETYLACGKADEAAAMFDAMERLGVLNVDVLNRVAAMLLDQGKMGPALEVLLRSQRVWPGQQVLASALQVILAKRPKVAFFHCGSGEDEVLGDACRFIQQRFRTELRANADPIRMAQLMDWSDISWFDGGGAAMAEALRVGKARKIVVSLRPCDVHGDWTTRIPWEKVDVLVQIGGLGVGETLSGCLPHLHSRTRLVTLPHAMNLDQYAFRSRARGKRLACLGRLAMAANPPMLLQCMQKLHYLDPEYRLFFCGRFETPALEEYLRQMVQTLGLGDVVFFEPRPRDLNGWLSDKHYIVAAGIDESQVHALWAGMACGLKPVIHHFPGAQTLLPPQHLFDIAEQFCEQILSQDYEPEQYRRFVEQHNPLREQLEAVKDILAQLETEIGPQAIASTGLPAAVNAQP
jgi:tetratricopeptide (TPR) repeat protein